MNFSERPASKQWAALTYRGEPFAEVWFKPEGEPLALAFRIPRESFQLPGLAEQLTAENLLKAVGVAAGEVESWREEGAPPPGADGPDSELGRPLPPPPQDVTHLNLHVSLKPPPPAAAPDESREHAVPEGKWQELEARWNSILGLEASIDTLRISMEALRAEMETSWRRVLTTEEKLNALSADVVHWNKAKSRVPHALPKAREFIHRATWAAGAPERKKLEAIHTNHIRPRVPFARMDQLVGQLESLLKDRQVLSAHGASVYQECKSVTAEVQRALRALQGNAAANATKKRHEAAARGKFF